MRRIKVMVIGGVMAAFVLTPGIAGAAVRHGKGSMTGLGGVLPGCEGNPGGDHLHGNGSVAVKHLRIDTYVFDACLTQIPTGGWDVVGTATFHAKSVVTVAGTINETIPSGSPTFKVTITNGTGRYRRARGTITMGPLTQSNFNTCDPRTGLCINWTDTGPFSGRLTHVQPRH